MGIFFNFNMPKPRQFHYSPRFYDERKERLEKMKANADAEIAAEKDRAGYVGLKRGFLNERRANSKLRHSSFEKKSALRFFIILLVLLGLVYLVSPEIFTVFWKSKN